MARATQLRAAPQSGTELGGVWGRGGVYPSWVRVRPRRGLLLHEPDELSDEQGVLLLELARGRGTGTGTDTGRGAVKVAGRPPGPAAPRPARQ